MHIEANRQAYRYNLFVESADKYKFNYRRVSYGQNTLGNTTGRLFVHRRSQQNQTAVSDTLHLLS